MKKFFLMFFSAFISITALAQEAPKDSAWKFSALAQIIPYLDARDFNNNTYPQFFAGSKIRFGAEKEFMGITFRADVQDSRVWGESGDPGANLKNLDLLQGYLQFNDVFTLPVDIQIGRFQMIYGDERFIGRSPFHYYERSFDGLRFKYSTQKMEWDLFGTMSYSDQPYRLGALPGKYELNAKPYESQWLLGTWYKNRSFEKINFHLFAYYELDPKLNPFGDYLASRVTAGTMYEGDYGPLKAKLQGAYQFGNVSLAQFNYGSRDVSAYYFSVNASYDFGPAKATLGTDWHSGSKPDDSSGYGLFSNRFGSKHAYFGYMDYFTNIDVQTKNLGANDFYLMTDIRLTKSVNAVANMHYFMSNRKSLTGKSSFGPEFDFGIVYNISKNIFVEWMNGIFVPQELMKEIWISNGIERNDIGAMSYLRVMFRI